MSCLRKYAQYIKGLGSQKGLSLGEAHSEINEMSWTITGSREQLRKEVRKEDQELRLPETLTLPKATILHSCLIPFVDKH